MDGKQLRNSILQWAIHGKLVPQDPNDEPASVLLERIREEKARLVKEKKIKRDKNESIIYRGEDNSYYEKFLATGEVKCINTEIPFELPNGWEWCRLCNIASVYGGKRIPVGQKLTTTDTGHKYIRVSDMKNSSVKLDDIHYISDDIFQQIKTYTISKDDLYITVAGTIGAVGEIPNELDNANLTENADKIVFSMVNKRFLMYSLQSELVQSQIRNCTTKVGQPKLAIMRIQNLLIALPPINEENRIVRAIEAVLPSVSKYSQVQKQLEKHNSELFEKLKKSILQQAIQGKLVEQNPDDEPASKLLEKIRVEKERLVKEGKLKKSALNDSVIFKGDDNKFYEKRGKEIVCIDDEIPFDIPGTWQWVRLTAIFHTIMGQSPDGNSVTTNGQGIEFHQGKLAFNDIYLGVSHVVTNKPTKVVDGNSLLLCVRAPVGILNITQREICIGRGLCALIPYHEGFDIMYWFFILSSYKQYFEKKATGSTFTAISNDIISNTLVPLPPLKEQKRIVNAIEKAWQVL